MNEKRPVASTFIEAMERGLEKGHYFGRRGWERRWSGCDLEELQDELLLKMQEEYAELVLAVMGQHPAGGIEAEAADLANLAMMIADMSLLCATLGAEAGEEQP